MTEPQITKTTAHRMLGLKLDDGRVLRTDWDARSTDDLQTAYDVLREIDGVERVWIDHRERVLDTD